MKHVRAAAVQFHHVPGDKQTNLARLGEFARAAAAHAVDLLVFPEMCITGYWHVRKLSRQAIAELAEPVPGGPAARELLALADRTGMTIGAGLIEAGADGQFYNTYVAAMPDGRMARHRKLHCFISPHMASGDSYTVFDAPQGCRIGILVCYDNNLGENVRITALKGAEILFAPHQTGGCRTPSPRCMGAIDPALWHQRAERPEPLRAEFLGPKGREWLMHWLPARAHDNGLFLVYSNGVGLDDDEVRTGNAMILDPYGDILAETDAVDEDTVAADLDPGLRRMCTGARWIKTRRPELYAPLTTPTGTEEDTRTVRFAGLDEPPIDSAPTV
ncbi:MAG: acyltransferase [Kiritimatiellaeota bacterium]|nr:acyltransferase [Kiritimatiellota bacterium]